MNKEFFEEFFEDAEDIPNGICCVCGHKLGNHIDEGDVWRCHSLGQDAYQCECALRKGRVFGLELDTVDHYDLKKRIEEKVQEIKEGWG